MDDKAKRAKLKAAGVSDRQIDRALAKGIDLNKLLEMLEKFGTILKLILGIITK